MNLPLAISRLRGDNRVPQTFWNKLPIGGSSRSQATMDALREMYAKVDEFEKEIAYYDHITRVCAELVDAKIECQNKLIQKRQYWLERIDRHEMLPHYLQSKADERKAKEEAERKPEEEAGREAAAKEEADKAATRRPIAKSALLLKKPRTREI